MKAQYVHAGSQKDISTMSEELFKGFKLKLSACVVGDDTDENNSCYVHTATAITTSHAEAKSLR